MPSAALTALRGYTGTDGPELAAAVDTLSLEQIDELTAVIAVAVRTPPAAAPPPTQVWPLVTLRASTFASGGVYRDSAAAAGLNLTSALNPRATGTGQFSDSILRALLYAHGLVIEDPLAAAADMVADTVSEVRMVARLALSAAVKATLEIAPLLDNDVVVTYFSTADQLAPAAGVAADIIHALDRAEDANGRPGGGFSTADAWEAFEASYVDGLSPSLRALWRQIRAGDRSPPLDLVEAGVSESDADVVATFIKILAHIRPRAVIENAVNTVAANLVAIETLGGGYDVLSPAPLFTKMLFLGSADPAHEARMHELARVDVPGIGQLSTGDAVAIRQHSEQFARWREDLTAAITQAEHARAAGHTPGQVANLVRAVVADARADLERDAQRSRFLAPANSMSFVAGALGGALAGAPGGTVGASFGAAGGTVALLVQAALNARRVPGYLRRHYVAFERPAAAAGIRPVSGRS